MRGWGGCFQEQFRSEEQPDAKSPKPSHTKVRPLPGTHRQDYCCARGGSRAVAPTLGPERLRWSVVVRLAIGVTSLLASAHGFDIQACAQQYSSPTRSEIIF